MIYERYTAIQKQLLFAIVIIVKMTFIIRAEYGWNRQYNYWIMEYHREGFVRWSILDCTSSTAIGTMELFKRSANDVYDNTAVLRLDLLSKYEEQSCLQEILSLILPHIRDLFQCTQVITKCVQEAEKRRAVLLEMGFSPSKEPLVGWDGTLYQNYYLRKL